MTVKMNGMDTVEKWNNRATSAASLNEQVNQIVDGLNNKRKKDAEMLPELKATLLSQVETAYNKIEQHMYETYDRHGTEFNKRVQHLFQFLERITKLEDELKTFKQDLTSLCQDLG